MTTLSQSPSTEDMLELTPAAPHVAGGLQLAKRISWMAKRIVEYIETRADHYAAAAMYQQLSRLSDAELHHRGLSRSTLARDVTGAFGGT
jgi:hypothetical protein